MIKGRYIAWIEINFHVDEKEGIRPFDDIKDDIANGNMTEMLTELIKDELDEDFADVNVTQQYADLYSVEDGDSDENR